MKIQWFVGIAAACATAGVSAQNTSSASAGTAARQARSGSTMTIVGCLQSGSQGDRPGTDRATGTSGSAAGSGAMSSAADRFVLTDANARGTSATTATTGGSGRTDRTGATNPGDTAGTDSARPGMEVAASTYTLIGNATELRNHIGHQIEVVGRMSTMRSSSSPGANASGSRAGSSPGVSADRAGSAGAPSGSAATNGDTRPGTDRPMSGQSLEVQSVRMIAATCAQ